MRSNAATAILDRGLLYFLRFQSLKAAGIELCFAEMKDPVKDKLKRFGLFAQLGEDTFFATVGESVSRYVERYGIEWSDWEDRGKGPDGSDPAKREIIFMRKFFDELRPAACLSENRI
jgi:hypothetical protein